MCPMHKIEVRGAKVYFLRLPKVFETEKNTFAATRGTLKLRKYSLTIMGKTYFEDKIFEKEDFLLSPLEKGDYENCIFINCNFAGADLLNVNFSECEFRTCNLSMAGVTNTAFRDVRFKDCKMLGLHFQNCNPFLFAVNFENCTLNLASFYKLNIKKTKFLNCTLKEADFSSADLSNAKFENCDLLGAVFERTNLEKADLRSAINYSIDPESNRIKKARFSLPGIPGLLNKYGIEIDY